MFNIIKGKDELINWMEKHQLSTSSIDLNTFTIVNKIKEQIINGKDNALKELTKQFDNVEIDDFRVSNESIQKAYLSVDDKYIKALKKAASNIYEYHQNQVPIGWEDRNVDRTYGLQYSALEAVGLYVPGGRAAYPSSVLMTAIPAKIAGCERLVITSPPTGGDIPASVLVAADIAGVNEIYRVGGAQAIFALAYGSQSIEAVDKIVGPGNKFVTAAKQMVYGVVDIDKPAGPSEVCVAIDNINDSKNAAAECFAQLEHDPDSSAIVITTSQDIADEINNNAGTQVKKLKRQDIINQSKKNSIIVVIDKESDFIPAINQAASEHLVLLSKQANEYRKKIRHAGSIFCGSFSPVTLGDYYAGPNHVLPTARSARFASPLGVMDFMKYSSYLEYSEQALKESKSDLYELTMAEGFDAHYQSVEIRCEND